MATKPSTWPIVWCSNAVYTTGPFIGSPGKVAVPGGVAAEGHRPGALFPTAAEYENYNDNLITTVLTDWVRLGSSAGAADAHLVETDSTGRATLHGLTVTNTTTQTPVFATGNGVLAPVYRATNPNGGDGYVANLNGSTGSAFYSEISASSKGLEIEMDTVVAGVGVLVTADAATTAEALTITHDGVTNHAASITTTGASCMALRLDAADDAALYCDGGVSGSAAILAVGKVDASGVRGSGGPSGANGVEGFGTGTGTAGVFGLADQYGVSGLSTNATSGFGVYGESDNAAGLGGGGVYGNGQNLGSGVFGESVNGYGGLFTADGARQTLFMSSRISDPTQTLTGGLWNRQTLGLSTFVANTARRMWHTAGGACIAMNFAGSGTATSVASTIVSCTASGADAPVTTGRVWILATVEVGRNSGTPDVVIQVGDSTTPNYPISNTIQLFQTAGAGVYERNLAYIAFRDLPAAGARTFEISLQSTNVGENINWRNAGIAVIGVF